MPSSRHSSDTGQRDFPVRLSEDVSRWWVSARAHSAFPCHRPKWGTQSPSVDGIYPHCLIHALLLPLASWSSSQEYRHCPFFLRPHPRDHSLSLVHAWELHRQARATPFPLSSIALQTRSLTVEVDQHLRPQIERYLRTHLDYTESLAAHHVLLWRQLTLAHLSLCPVHRCMPVDCTEEPPQV